MSYGERPCRVGLVVSVSASHTVVGRVFASRPVHTNDLPLRGGHAIHLANVTP